MKTYTAFWRDGKRQEMKGETVEAAFTNAGYGGGALRALDFWTEGTPDNYEWDTEKRTWVNTLYQNKLKSK